MEKISEFKKTFGIASEPFFAMLMHRKEEMKKSDWIKFVDKTMESIIQNPDQYLGNDLPSPETTRIIVTEIIQEFLHQEKILV